MSSKGDSFKVLDFNDLIINEEGKAGIPFNILREEFGFTIVLKDSKVYIKKSTKELENYDITKIGTFNINATDDFEEDTDFLKRNLGFKEYYQDSIIYNSEKRGIKHYDIIITEVGECYNITLKGQYEEYCDIYSTTNVIPKLLEFYFPISYKEVIKKLLDNDSKREVFDGRETLVRSYEIDSREIIFSKEGQRLA